MVLNAPLRNAQYYKVRIKGKVEQLRKCRSAPQHLSLLGIENGAFGSPSTNVINFLFKKDNHIYIYI